MHSLARKPHNNLFPPADFGARLFGSLGPNQTSETQVSGRRRAFTEINELLASDVATSQARPNTTDIRSNLNLDSSQKADEATRKRDQKF